MAELKVRKRILRSRSYVMDRLEIGTFIVEGGATMSFCSNKLRIYFVQRQIIYDTAYYVDATSQTKVLVAICIPFDILTGICCKSREIYLTISSPPRMVIGSSGTLPMQAPPPDNFDPTNGQASQVFFHKITLARAQGMLIQQHLLAFDVHLSNLFRDLVPQAPIAAIGYSTNNTQKQEQIDNPTPTLQESTDGKNSTERPDDTDEDASD